VLRGVHREGVARQELQQLHDTSATLVTSCLDEATCILASTMGVLIVARLGGDAADIATRLRGLANYPAVGLAIIESKTVIQADLRREAPNIVLLARADADHLMSPPAWVGAFVSDCGTLERRPSWLGTLPNPVLAERLLAPTYRLSIPAARAACDRLQRDLAPEFDLAGYIV
jgi:hypothetical protein